MLQQRRMTRLGAVLMIWIGCALGWVVLGGTLVTRSGETSSSLREEVTQLWGPPLSQRPLAATLRGEKEPEELAIDGSDIAVRLTMEQRQKGLLWFPTYIVDFDARYEVVNPAPARRDLQLQLPIATEHVVYDGFQIERTDGGAVLPVAIHDGGAHFSDQLAPGEQREYRVSYRARGTSRWQYIPQSTTGQIKNFRLAIETNFGAVDFAPGSLAPSSHRQTPGGWRGEWTFRTLVASSAIGLVLPQKLNPGPLAARITFFAPVGLLFFFFVIAVAAVTRRIPLHPLHYFFMGCGFFAFHLLFAYLVDHLSIAASFAIASATALALVVSYARLVVGWRFATREVAVAELIYLVLFSWSFMWEGMTGLAITIGAVITLFVMMQATGRVQWDELGGCRAAPAAGGVGGGTLRPLVPAPPATEGAPSVR
jgi:hypothetical protein